MRTILLSMLGASLAFASLHAEPKAKKAQPIPTPSEAASAKPPRIHEFHGEEIASVLRTLARSAKINILVSDDITGTIALRVENKTPREVIEIIAELKDLVLDDRDGILRVRPEHPPAPGAAKKPDLEQAMLEGFTEMLAPTVTKFYDTLLDYEGRPETAKKIAKAKKALFDALIAEGFTREEAFRIILADQGLSLPDSNR